MKLVIYLRPFQKTQKPFALDSLRFYFFVRMKKLICFGLSLSAISFCANAATVVPITTVFGHNESTNFTGSIGDMINGSGMNGNTSSGDPNWYTTNASDPATWTLTPTGSFSGPDPLYGAEWQSQDILDGEGGDDTATNGKIGWTVLDFGQSVANLDTLYIWHVRENVGRVAGDYNIYIASSPTVGLTHGPTSSSSTDYDFASGGWSQIFSNQVGTQSGLQTFDLNGASARYIGLEIIDNSSADTKVGFQEIGVSAIPEPSAALLGALGFVALLRRRR